MNHCWLGRWLDDDENGMKRLSCSYNVSLLSVTLSYPFCSRVSSGTPHPGLAGVHTHHATWNPLYCGRPCPMQRPVDAQSRMNQSMRYSPRPPRHAKVGIWIVLGTCCYGQRTVQVGRRLVRSTYLGTPLLCITLLPFVSDVSLSAVLPRCYSRLQ